MDDDDDTSGDLVSGLAGLGGLSGGLSGAFSQIVVASEAPNLSWRPIYTATSLGLQAVPKTIAPQLYLLLLQD